MKKCFKCGVMRPLDEFYRHPQMGDGHLNKCKSCTRRDVRANYEARRPQYLAYERARYGPARIAALAASNKRHPLHHRARWMVYNAVKRGKLQRGSCEFCGSLKVEAHHEDYTKPLAVRWLCRRHHRMAHRMEAA